MTSAKKPRKTKPLKIDDVQLDPESTESESPAAWGDREITEAEAAAAYEADRPPHHGD